MRGNIDIHVCMILKTHRNDTMFVVVIVLCAFNFQRYPHQEHIL